MKELIPNKVEIDEIERIFGLERSETDRLKKVVEKAKIEVKKISLKRQEILGVSQEFFDSVASLGNKPLFDYSCPEQVVMTILVGRIIELLSLYKYPFFTLFEPVVDYHFNSIKLLKPYRVRGNADALILCHKDDSTVRAWNKVDEKRFSVSKGKVIFDSYHLSCAIEVKNPSCKINHQNIAQLICYLLPYSDSQIPVYGILTNGRAHCLVSLENSLENDKILYDFFVFDGFSVLYIVMNFLKNMHRSK